MMAGIQIRAPLKTPVVILSKAKDPAETPEESGFFAALRMTDRCLHGFLEVPISN